MQMVDDSVETSSEDLISTYEQYIKDFSIAQERLKAFIDSLIKEKEELKKLSIEVDNQKREILEVAKQSEDAKKRAEEGIKFLEEKQTTLDKRERELSDKEKILDLKEKELFDRNVNMENDKKNMDIEIEKRILSIKPKEDELLKKENELQNFEYSLKEKEQNLLTREKELIESEILIKNIRDKLNNRQKELDILEEELIAKRKAVLGREELLMKQTVRDKSGVSVNPIKVESSVSPPQYDDIPAAADAKEVNKIPDENRVAEDDQLLVLLTEIQKLQEKAQYMGVDANEIVRAQRFKEQASRAVDSKEAKKLFIESIDVLNRSIEKKLIQATKAEGNVKETWRGLQQQMLSQSSPKQTGVSSREAPPPVIKTQPPKKLTPPPCPACGHNNFSEVSPGVFECTDCGYKTSVHGAGKDSKPSLLDKTRKRIISK